MPDDLREPERHVMYVQETADIYCFTFEDFPEAAAGGTLSTPVMSVNKAGPTFGSPVVLTSDFLEYDGNGNVANTVASGKGVKVAITPGDNLGQFDVRCTVTITLNAVASGRTKRMTLVVQ